MARTRGSVEKAPAERRATAGPRGRPTAERAAAIDEIIRSAALDQFLAHGFEGASMDAIVATAQVSKGTLYARYDNKEALFLSVLQGQRELLSNRASAFNHLIPGDVEGRLRHHARTLLQASQSPEYNRVLQLVESNAASFPQLAKIWHEVGTEGYLRLLADSLAEAAPPAERHIDWNFVAGMFLHAISGWHRTQAAMGLFDPESAAVYGENVVGVIMAWLREQARPEIPSA